MAALHLLVLTSILVQSAVTEVQIADRKTLLDAAIIEVKHEREEFDMVNPSTQPLSIFGHPSLESLKQGRARLLFEDMVHHAETKILADEKQELPADDTETKAEHLAKRLFHTPGSLLTRNEIVRIYQESNCSQAVVHPTNCSAIRFRTANGTCNNLQNPLFGTAGTPFRQLLQPQYEDGISQLRGTMQGENSGLLMGPFSPPNPSSRLINLLIVHDRPILDGQFSHLLMQWGQFLDHDLQLAPAFREPCDSCTTTEQCVPIPVAKDDPSFGDPASEEELCLPFSRTIPACDQPPVYSVIPRKQLNEMTSFIDGSQIYGSSEDVMRVLRDTSSGRLLTGPNVPVNGKPSLPIVNSSRMGCMGRQNCFLAGDNRVNEQTALTVMHTIWLREHNRIAHELQALNPQWDRETVFQTARQIVGAELQKITYKSYLPLILGENVFNEQVGNYTRYNDQINPAVPNAFAIAALQFTQSQVQPFFDRLDENFEPTSAGPLSLVNAFFNSSQFSASGGTDPLIRGMLTQPAQKVDEYVTNSLTNHFVQTDSSPGMDLVSLIIQRGRDHGLPPYMTWKRWAQRTCGLSSEFENQLTFIRLLQTYGSLETVDLWVGGLAEERLPGSLVGATFACIFAKTFTALRDGDRFYYENTDQTTLFNAEQRSAVEDVSLSRIICDSADNIQEIQPNAFRVDQGRVPCSSIPTLDLNAWKVDCHMKIQVNRQLSSMRFTSLSLIERPHMRRKRSRSSARILRRFESTVNVGETTFCLGFQCPTMNQPTIVSIYPRDGRSRCSVRHSSLLPRNWAVQAAFYTSRIRLSNFSPQSGLYSDLTSCASGSVIALYYTCTSTQSNKLVQESPQCVKAIQNSAGDEDEDNRNEIPLSSPLIPENVRTYIREGMNLPANEKDTSQYENEQKKRRLISVLEQLIQELQSEHALP